MSYERQESSFVETMRVKFKNFKKHSDSLDDFFVDSEPSNRVKASSEGTQNKADKAFEQMVNTDVMPNRKNGGVKKQENRRYR